MEPAAVQAFMCDIVEFERTKGILALSDPMEVDELEELFEKGLTNFWNEMAALQCVGMPNWECDPTHPGYIKIKYGTGSDNHIYLPFHLASAAPESALWEEITQLADRVCVGSVHGQKAAICLSGSTVVWKDLQAVGDIDFCEYAPDDVEPAVIASALTHQIANQQPYLCIVALQTKGIAPETKHVFYQEVPEPSLKLGEVRALIKVARNGKTSYLARTSFTGVTEVSNWLIFYNRADLEGDPVSSKSFAFQEAALGAPGRRRLSVCGALEQYLSFLQSQMREYTEKDPAKFLKRAIPWLRLLCAQNLQDELLALEDQYDVAHSAATLAKLQTYLRFKDTGTGNAVFRGLILMLQRDLFPPNIPHLDHQVLSDKIQAFGAELNSPKTDMTPSLSSRIISLVDARF